MELETNKRYSQTVLARTYISKQHWLDHHPANKHGNTSRIKNELNAAVKDSEKKARRLFQFQFASKVELELKFNFARVTSTEQ